MKKAKTTEVPLKQLGSRCCFKPSPWQALNSTFFYVLRWKFITSSDISEAKEELHTQPPDSNTSSDQTALSSSLEEPAGELTSGWKQILNHTQIWDRFQRMLVARGGRLYLPGGGELLAPVIRSFISSTQGLWRKRQRGETRLCCDLTPCCYDSL